MWGNDWILHDRKMLIVPGYLRLQKMLRDRFGCFEKCGISGREIMQAWEKCAIGGISLDSFWPRRSHSENTDYDEVPEGWEERYGAEGYWITMRELEPEEIRAAVKQLAREYPGTKIKPSEYYRVLFFYEIAHTLPRCGRYPIEFVRIEATEKFWEQGERFLFEQKAWRWAIKMAKRKNPKIRILYRTADKERKLEIERCLREQREKYEKEHKMELAKREKGQTLRKAA